ncbi:hypothetical protein [Capillimicrobium parvum]|uniref:Vanillate/3-O-methylgallate O-demethylase n=1 Tax=Capillimicrobium parvum TaxID=2884022 RepID=A0A9E6XZE1_9ACTN|nr:hypothetical protein [Capillimicrobium parvum]UGS37280.1 Vanillate/3-O-methylgallate O-demethylase [Capillimicrobium parvum]
MTSSNASPEPKVGQPSTTVDFLRKPLYAEFDLMWGAPQYTSWIDESLSWKETCYLGDWSWLPDMRFTGPDVFRLFSDISVNTMDPFAIGQSKHIIHCNPDGKLIGEGILSRIGEQEVAQFGQCVHWTNYQLRKGGYDVSAEPLEWTNLHLQGPLSIYVLERAAGQSVRDAGYMRSTPVTIAGHEVLALRQGMTGEIGFELQAPKEFLAEISNAILEAGQEYGIRRMGAKVSMLNHLEAAYPTVTLDYLPAIFDEWSADFRDYLDVQLSDAYGAPAFDLFYKVAGSFDTDDPRDYYRSPVEFDWAGRIKFDHEFIGREALAEEVANPRRVLRTLVWHADDVLKLWGELFRKGDPLPDFMDMPRERRGYMYADQVLADGAPAGVSTSRGYSAYFREMLSLAVIDVDHSEIGNEVAVVWGNPGTAQREIRAMVALAPYKENRGRVDLSQLPATPA